MEAQLQIRQVGASSMSKRPRLDDFTPPLPTYRPAECHGGTGVHEGPLRLAEGHQEEG